MLATSIGLFRRLSAEVQLQVFTNACFQAAEIESANFSFGWTVASGEKRSYMNVSFKRLRKIYRIAAPTPLYSNFNYY